MEKKFRWYKRLHALLSSSPVHDYSGLANSVTPVNLAVLSQRDGRSSSDSVEASPAAESTANDMDIEVTMQSDSFT